MSITTLGLTSTSTQGLAPFTVGHAFKKGDVPSGASVVADFAGFQCVPKNVWPDGSLKFAILSGRTSLTANVKRDVVLSIGVPTGGASLTTADLKATGVTASIAAGAFGTVSWATTDWDTPFMAWASGPQMSSWIYRKAIGSDAHLVGWMEVRLFAGGEVEVLPWVENGYIRVAGPTKKSAIYTFTLGGSPRFSDYVGLDIPVTYGGSASFTTSYGDSTISPIRVRSGSLLGTATWQSNTNGVNTYGVAWDVTAPGAVSTLTFLGLPHHARTVLVAGSLLSHWLGADPNVVVKHDSTYLKSTALVPNLSATVSPTSALVTTLPSSYAPLQQGGYSDAMGGTGYQPAIGLMSQWDALYLTSTAPSVWAALQRNAYSVGRFPIHYRDENTNRPLRFDQFANFSINSSTINDYPPAATGGGAPGGWDIAHHPSVGFMAYLVTGRWFHMETLLFAATCNHVMQVDNVRQFAGGVFFSGSGACTVRGAAWAVRTLGQAATIVPDADTALRTNLIASLEANITFNHSTYVAQAHNPFGIVTPYGDGYGTDSDGKVQDAAWQQNFYTAAFGYVRAMNPPISGVVATKLAAFFEWKAKQPVGMLGGLAPTDWLYRDATPYTFTVAFVDFPDWAGGTGPWPASWGAMYTATTGSSNTGVAGDLRGGNFPNATSYWGNITPAIAYAVQHGAVGATASYSRMTSASNYNTLATDFTNAPEWSVVPLSTAASGASMAGIGATTRVDSGNWIAGKTVVGKSGLGILAQNVPSSGTNSAPPLFNDLVFPADNDKEVRWQVITPPASGTFFAYEDGSFLYTGNSNTANSLTYKLWEMGVDKGNATVTLNTGVLDSTIPVMQGAVTSSAITASGFTLSWPAATDNIGVTGYEVSIDNGTSYTNVGNVLTIAETSLAAGIVYNTKVRAYDTANNKAIPLSLAVSTSAAPDSTAPTMSGSITVSAITSSAFTLSWPIASDNVAVTGYEVSLDNGGTYTSIGNVLTATYTGKASSTLFNVKVRAFDTANNKAVPLSTTVTTLAATDTTLPVMNGSITVSAITTSGFNIAWPTATDNVGVAGYEYSTDNGVAYSDIGNVLTYTCSSMASGTLYNVKVRAYDAANNRATPLSTTVTTTAAVVDGTPPTMNGSITITALTTGGFTASWSSGSDNVGVIGYEISVDTGTPAYSQLGSTLTYTKTGLLSNTAYTVRVRDYDAAGNRSTPITASVTTTAAGSLATTVTLTFNDRNGSPRASLTGMKWAFFDQSTPNTLAAPSAKGISATTNSAGVTVINISGTTLSPGAVGWLVFSNSDGTATQSNLISFAGPVVVA